MEQDKAKAEYIPTQEELAGNSWSHCYGMDSFLPIPIADWIKEVNQRVNDGDPDSK